MVRGYVHVLPSSMVVYDVGNWFPATISVQRMKLVDVIQSESCLCFNTDFFLWIQVDSGFALGFYLVFFPCGFQVLMIQNCPGYWLYKCYWGTLPWLSILHNIYWKKDDALPSFVQFFVRFVQEVLLNCEVVGWTRSDCIIWEPACKRASDY